MIQPAAADARIGIIEMRLSQSQEMDLGQPMPLALREVDGLPALGLHEAQEFVGRVGRATVSHATTSISRK